MITKTIVYNAKCDFCGEVFEQEYAGWNDKGFLRQMMHEANWIILKDKVYCDNCYEYNDDGNLVIKGGQNGNV